MKRARVVRAHIVTDIEQLPDCFRRRVETTAARPSSVPPSSEQAATGPRRPFLFDRLDELFPEERSPTGVPSTADFLLHELPPLIDFLAQDNEAATLEVRDAPEVRVLIAPACLSLM